MVAIVLLRAPNQKIMPGDKVSVFSRFDNTSLNLSKVPYVIAGLTHKINDGFNPFHSPVTPSSPVISLAVPSKFLRSLELVVCCLVDMTETGIVKICAKAPANAPNNNSESVDNDVVP